MSFFKNFSQTVKSTVLFAAFASPGAMLAAQSEPLDLSKDSLSCVLREFDGNVYVNISTQDDTLVMSIESTMHYRPGTYFKRKVGAVFSDTKVLLAAVTPLAKRSSESIRADIDLTSASEVVNADGTTSVGYQVDFTIKSREYDLDSVDLVTCVVKK